MLTPRDLYGLNHRKQQVALVGFFAVAALVGLLPRNERALFLTPFPEGPKAFAAIVPTPPIQFGTEVAFQVPRPGPRAFFARVRRPGVPPPSFTSIPRSPGGPSGVGGPEVPFDAAGFVPEGAVVPDFGPISSRTLLGGPGPLAFGPGAAPGGTSSGGPPPSSSGGDPIPAVPEPASWIMMLTGFLGLGTVLRRARRRGSFSSVATDSP